MPKILEGNKKVIDRALRNFIGKIGEDKVIESIGEDKVIESIGEDKVIESIGEDRIIEMLKRRLPREKLEKLLLKS